jgi:hypothetical protein
VAVLDELETHGDDLIIEIVRGNRNKTDRPPTAAARRLNVLQQLALSPPRNSRLALRGLAKAAGSQGPYMGVPPRSTIHPSSSSRATIAARDETPSLAKTRLRWEATVHELMSSTEAIVLLG